jgi:hypothetical protein
MNRLSTSKRHGRCASWSVVSSVVLFTLVLLPLTGSLHLHAQDQSSDTSIWHKHETREAVLYIGRINADTTADTIIGKRAKNIQHVPDRIIWGAKTTGKKFTDVVYPKWRSMTGSVSILDLNLDSLPDMILHVRGKISDSSGNEVEMRDTSRIVVIFAQAGLDTVKKIEVGDIAATFQTTPFFAMDLFGQELLTEPGVRDLSGRTSYLLVPVENPGSRAEEAVPVSGIPSPMMVAWPNPTTKAINVRISNVPVGSYRLRVLAVNGALFNEQTLEFTDPGQIERTLSLATVPTGYYVMQIFDQTKIIATYPFVVVH